MDDRTATDDFTRLRPTAHMLRWLADEPFVEIRAGVESLLRLKVPDGRLLAIRVTSDPQWLTGARPRDGDATKAILVRCGVAFECALSVTSAGRTRELRGVFTWVGIELDQPGRGRHRVWLDVGGTLDCFGADGELKARMDFGAH